MLYFTYEISRLIIIAILKEQKILNLSYLGTLTTPMLIKNEKVIFSFFPCKLQSSRLKEL
jgi:hypothetical protein